MNAVLICAAFQHRLAGIVEIWQPAADAFGVVVGVMLTTGNNGIISRIGLISYCHLFSLQQLGDANMRMMVLVMTFMVGWLIELSAQTNLISLSDLDSARKDCPKFLTATTNISVALQYGAVEIPKGEKLSVLLVNHGKISILRGGMTNEIPAIATDIVERINSVRSHRIIIDKDQYEDCRIEVINPAEVKVSHTAGIATISMIKLSPELQKQLGYDEVKSAEWQAAQQKTRASQQQEQDAINKRLAATSYMTGTVEQIIPQGIIVGFHAPGYTKRNDYAYMPGVSKALVHIAPTDRYILLIGHPKQNELAEGNPIYCHGYKEGVITIEDQTLEKWFYCEAPPQKDSKATVKPPTATPQKEFTSLSQIANLIPYDIQHRDVSQNPLLTSPESWLLQNVYNSRLILKSQHLLKIDPSDGSIVVSAQWDNDKTGLVTCKFGSRWQEVTPFLAKLKVTKFSANLEHKIIDHGSMISIMGKITNMSTTGGGSTKKPFAIGSATLEDVEILQ